tara:strand:- start:1121 stop:1870 length:750 start_codon:yes stop_codon:yes gene_type:complete
MTEGPRLLDWDSRFFGFPVAEHRLDGPGTLAPSLAKARGLGATLLVVKTPHGTALETDADAFLADTQITFGMPSDRPVPDWRIGPVKLERYEARALEDDMARLGVMSGAQSRFFHDPVFPDAAARALYVRWIDRIVSQDFSDRTLVLVERTPAGDICAMGASYIDADGLGVPALMAVKPRGATPGFGRAYFSAMMRWFKDQGVHEAHIKTQTRSHSACNLYDRAGWERVRTDDIYHIWLADPVVKPSYI